MEGRPQRNRTLPAKLRDYVLGEFRSPSSPKTSVRSASITSSAKMERLRSERAIVTENIDRYCKKAEQLAGTRGSKPILENLNSRLEKSFNELKGITSKIKGASDQLFPLEIEEATKTLLATQQKVEDCQDDISMHLADQEHGPTAVSENDPAVKQRSLAESNALKTPLNSTTPVISSEQCETPYDIKQSNVRVGKPGVEFGQPSHTSTIHKIWQPHGHAPKPVRIYSANDVQVDESRASIDGTRPKYSEHSPGLYSYSQPSQSEQESVEIKKFFQGMAKPNLPKFGGKRNEFLDWWEQFDVFVHQADVPIRFKMVMLKNTLTGKVAELVKGLGYSENQYNTAIKKLHDRYGGEQRILQSYVDAILKVEPMDEIDLDKLERFTNLLQDIVAKLCDAGQENELEGQSTLYTLVQQRTPDELLVLYKISGGDHADGLRHFVDWLNEQVNLRLETAELKTTAKKKSRQEAPSKSKSTWAKGAKNNNKAAKSDSGSSQVHATGSDDQKSSSTPKTMKTTSTTPICPICENKHLVSACSQWNKASTQERWNLAKQFRVCYRCLKIGHLGKDCRGAGKCGIEGCDKTHHRSLHPASKPSDNPTVTSVEKTQSAFGISTDGRVKPTKVALRLIPVYLVGHGGKKRKVNAFLDDGSDSSYIRSEVIEDMGLEVENTSLKVSTLLSEETQVPSGLVELTIESLDGCTLRKIGARTLQHMCENFVVPDWAKLRKKWSHLEGIPFPKIEGRKKVDLLIGSDHPELALALEERTGNTGDPVARKTPLGWTCVGSIGLPQEHGIVHYAQTYCSAIMMDEALRKLWNADATPSTGSPPLTQEEKLAVEKAEQSLEFRGDRYKVGIPWKADRPNLTYNYAVAERRLRSLETNLKRKPEIAQSYKAAMSGNIEKGYFRELTSEEVESPGWYLPHFGVIREDRETTKVRVVYDSAATYAGKSLNDEMLTGPKQQLDILDILISFRKGAVALVGDIKEMFCQVVMDEQDRKYHRILWRDLDSSQPVKVYEATRLLFGDRASPFLAQFVIRKHAETHQQQYPLAADVCLKSIYIDDAMRALDTVELVRTLRHQLEELLLKAGFVIRKWVSNSLEVMSEIPVQDRATGIVELEDSELPCVKSLGVRWDAAKDVFGYSHSEVTLEAVTKRILLSVIARLFDPLQLLAPFLIRGRMLLQQAWLEGLGWDERFPSTLENQVITWAGELPMVLQFEVPRCITRGTPMEESIHTFTDASEQAFGAVVYVRTVYPDESISVRIVVAKAKVAPLKAVSIPRLELLGALLGLRLSVRASELLQINSQTFWSDSMDVIFWVHGTSRQYKPFVAHRVAEIQEKSSPQQWRHVPGLQNPADLASRGSSMEDLIHKSMWTEGPEFLHETPDKWPPDKLRTSEVSPEAEHESKVSRSHAATTSAAPEPEELIDRNRFSHWMRLIRTTAWVLRFVKLTQAKVKARREMQLPYLKPQEIDAGVAYWIRKVQREKYGDVIQRLKDNKPSPSGPLRDLTPLLDQDGLLRVGGRLQKSDLPYDTRHPLIVPAKNHITTLLVRHAHGVVGKHSKGVNAVLAELRQNFWVVNGREEIKRVDYQCIICRRRKQTTAKQIMAPLPAYRVRVPLRAFSRLGVDFAGPFLVKITRRVHAKRWLCLFTCTATRAVHLEMAYSLDTPGFLNTFSRMVARRGKPERVVSDNGTNFVGANRELGELVQALDQQSIADSGASEGIEWSFNPPLGSHHGGLFEALIKSAKKALKAVLGSAVLTDEELQTAIVEVEGLMNSRPLAYVSSDPKDEDVLTPNHFLIGQAGGQLAPRIVDEIAFNPRHRWRYVQDLIKQVWQRWNKEFLSQLQTRGKWLTEERDLKLDDVVLMADSANPRGDWPLGRITEIMPGSDNHVRAVRVTSGGKSFIRPITKLCPLVLNTTDDVVADRFGHGGENVGTAPRNSDNTVTSEVGLAGVSSKG